MVDSCEKKYFNKKEVCCGRFWNYLSSHPHPFEFNSYTYLNIIHCLTPEYVYRSE